MWLWVWIVSEVSLWSDLCTCDCHNEWVCMYTRAACDVKLLKISGKLFSVFIWWFYRFCFHICFFSSVCFLDWNILFGKIYLYIFFLFSFFGGAIQHAGQVMKGWWEGKEGVQGRQGRGWGQGRKGCRVGKEWVEGGSGGGGGWMRKGCRTGEEGVQGGQGRDWRVGWWMLFLW